MSNAYLSPILNDAQFDSDGTFLAGGLIWFYQAGTTTPLVAYTSPDASVAWSNPIVLDARGETGGEVWLKSGSAYKMLLEGPPIYGQTHGTQIASFDNISGVNDPGTTTNQNWLAFAVTPAYISTTSFSVAGDYRTTFLVSRRLQLTVSAGTVYATVVSATYGSSITTVVVSPDYGQTLDAGLSAISYGFIATGAVSSIPVPVLAGSPTSGSQHQMWMNYNGTNLVWASDNGAASATWPIIAATASAAQNTSFVVTNPSGQSQLVTRTGSANDAELYNNATDWGLFCTDGGYGIKYTRATGQFSFGGFTLPTPAIPGSFQLPNGIKVAWSNSGTAAVGGNVNNMPVSFTSTSSYVVVTGITGGAGTTSSVVISATGTGSFTAYAPTSIGFGYVVIGY
jgi:hypothetical protein